MNTLASVNEQARKYHKMNDSWESNQVTESDMSPVLNQIINSSPIITWCGGV